jgi:endonuclease YncB( thermonuclease family)
MSIPSKLVGANARICQVYNRLFRLIPSPIFAGHMRRHVPFSALAQPRRGNVLAVAGAMFAIGLVAGAMVRPPLTPQLFTQHGAAPVEPAFAAVSGSEPAASDTPLAHRLDPNIVYPIDVLRIIDGDTFEARVRVWPGLDVDTKIRLRGIDAAELHARCPGELAQAQAARAALQTILADGGVTISHVGVDKYGGRVDATIATRNTAGVSAALLNGGFARSYDGGKRGSWCG